MWHKNREQELMNALILAYEDIREKDGAFASLLLSAYHEIEQGQSYQVICTRLMGDMTQYMIKNKFHVSENMVHLNEIVSEIVQRYRSWSITWL